MGQTCSSLLFPSYFFSHHLQLVITKCNNLLFFGSYLWLRVVTTVLVVLLWFECKNRILINIYTENVLCGSLKSFLVWFFYGIWNHCLSFRKNELGLVVCEMYFHFPLSEKVWLCRVVWGGVAETELVREIESLYSFLIRLLFFYNYKFKVICGVILILGGEWAVHICQNFFFNKVGVKNKFFFSNWS